MMHSVSFILSMSVVLVSVIVSFTSLGPLGVWIGIELGFMAVISSLSGFSSNESGSSIKYFIVQVMGSGLIGLGVIILVHFLWPNLSSMLIFIGISMKMGMFPFHFWVGPVMSNISWLGCFLVSVVQKLSPLWLMSNMVWEGFSLVVLEMVAAATSVVGAVAGLGVFSYRLLVAYSSLSHLGVMVMLAGSTEMGWIFYFYFYFFVSLLLMITLWKLSVYSFLDLTKQSGCESTSNVVWISLYFFSLAGVPPFLGCLFKLYFIANCYFLMPVGVILCIVSSAIGLYYYVSTVLMMSIFWGSGLVFGVKEEFKVLSVEGAVSLLMNLVVGLLGFIFVGFMVF